VSEKSVEAVAGGKTASPLGQASWLSYEMAQGPYFVAINVVIFAPFFAGEIVGDPVRGQELWGWITGAAGLAVALTSPFVGAHADASGARKPGLAISVLLAAIAVALFGFAEPGAENVVWLTAALVMISAMMLEYASLYHNALLPHIVSAQRVGSLSGLGYGVSYVGAFLLIGLWGTTYFIVMDLPEGSHLAERSIGPWVAAWTILFTIPLLLYTPDQPYKGRRFGEAMREGIRTLADTFAKARHYNNIVIFLLARTIFYDGILVTFAFTGIYVKGVFGWDTGQIAIFSAFVLALMAVSGALGGLVDDRIGSKRTIMISVFMFTVGLVGTLGTTETTIFYVPISEAAAQNAPPISAPLFSLGFTTLPEQSLFLIGFLTGIFGGPALASSRTMMARLAPPGQTAQFFGLYTLTGKATSFTGPFLIAGVTAATGSQRIGLAVLVLYLLIGWLGMFFVQERQAKPVEELKQAD